MLLRVVGLAVALATAGCGQRVAPPPSVPYDGAAVRPRVDVYFDEQPFGLELLQPQGPEQPREIILASCSRDCRLSVLPGRYRLRTRGDAPEVDRVVTLEHSSRIEVTKGNTAGRITGLSMIIGGGVTTVGLPLGLLTRQWMSENDKTPAVLAIVGATGLVTLLVGVLVQGASRTTLVVTPVQESGAANPGLGGFSF